MTTADKGRQLRGKGKKPPPGRSREVPAGMGDPPDGSWHRGGDAATGRQCPGGTEGRNGFGSLLPSSSPTRVSAGWLRSCGARRGCEQTRQGTSLGRHGGQTSAQLQSTQTGSQKGRDLKLPAGKWGQAPSVPAGCARGGC